MKRFFSTISIILAMSMLFGCAAKEQGTNAEAPAQSGEEKTLVIGLSSDWQTMDPAQMYEVFGNMYTYAVYDNLYKLEGSDLSDPKPCLASEYTLDDTGKVYTFKLKQGLKFASGNPITSKDVLFSINRTKNLKGNTAHHTDGIEKVEAPDDYTVIITLSQKDASFMAKIANNTFSILDSEIVKQNGGTDALDASTTDKATAFLNQSSAGSGAFVLKSWVPSTEMVLEKNPNYWGTPAQIDRVIIKEIPDPNTQVQMLEKGEIDVAFTLGQDQTSLIKDKPNLKIVSAPTATCSFLMMNQDATIGGPVSNPDVQQAIRYALDYNGLKLLAGEGALLPLSFVPEGFTGAKQRPDGYQNIDKAKELLAKAGYKDGFTITLTAANYDSEGLEWPVIAQKVADDLSKVGITVKIETGEIGVVIDAYRQGKSPFLVMHWSPDYYDVNNQLVYVPGDVIGTRANWPVAGNEALVALAGQIAVESDTAARTKISEQMQDMMAEQSPYAFMVQHPKIFAINAKVEGLEYNDLCKLQLGNVKIND